MRIRTCFAIPCLVMLAANPLPAWAEPSYTVTFLPEWLKGSAIDNAGRLAGVMPVPGGSRAFLYADGEVRDLGTLGGTRSFAYGMSDNGLVTGDAALASGASHAFLYANGTMRDLGTFPGGRSSIGVGVNNAGQVTGSASNSLDQTHAMLADSGGMRDLGTLGGHFSYGSGINNAGHVVGASTLAGDASRQHAFLYRDGVMTDLGALGGVRSHAHAINDRGQIIGAVVDAADAAHAFIRTDGVLTLLGDFGGPYTGAWDINNAGQVVGYSTSGYDINSRHGFLYTEGELLDINGLVDPALGWTVATALGINDAGRIFGLACRTDDLCRPVLLDPISAPPIPEPGGLAMLLAGLATGAYRHRLRRKSPPESNKPGSAGLVAETALPCRPT